VSKKSLQAHISAGGKSAQQSEADMPTLLAVVDLGAKAVDLRHQLQTLPQGWLQERKHARQLHEHPMLLLFWTISGCPGDHSLLSAVLHCCIMASTSWLLFTLPKKKADVSRPSRGMRLACLCTPCRCAHKNTVQLKAGKPNASHSI
jgi:hypothetical protein